MRPWPWRRWRSCGGTAGTSPRRPSAAVWPLQWPARVEVVARRPAVVLDAAHNAASIEALLETLDESFSARGAGSSLPPRKRKDLRGMI